MRIRWQPREKAAVLYMRRKYGYSINTLSEAFGRSASMIHKILRFNHIIGALRLKDLRRMVPDKVKKIGAARMRRMLRIYMPKWTMFILGEAERPP